MAAERIFVIFRGVIIWLDVMQSLADDVAASVGFGEDERFAIAMSLREGVNNAIIHGNGRDATKYVEVEFLKYEDRLEVGIKDQGPGFDVDLLPDPLSEENILKTSGRGVFLIRHYMDEIDLGRTNLAGGEIRMVKRLPGTASEA